MKTINAQLRNFWHFNRLLFFITDLILFFISVMAAFRLSPTNPYVWSLSASESPLYLQAIFLPICLALGLQLSNIQKHQARFRRTETLVRIILGSSLGATAFVVFHALVHFQLAGRYLILISWGIGCVITFCARALLWRIIHLRPRLILFWGSQESAESCIESLQKSNLPVYVAGRIEENKIYPSRALSSLIEGDHSIKVVVDFSTPIPEMPSFDDGVEVTIEDLQRICTKLQVGSLILSTPHLLTNEEKRVVTLLMSKGLSAQTLSDFYEQEFERVHLPSISESWLWDHEVSNKSPYYIGSKRLIDIVLSLCALMILTPVIPIIAMLIWIQDRGPVIYSQERIGKYGEPFRIYKFRTMRINAEKGGAQWAQKNDQRVTRLGKWLRKSRFDEVPQFFNILIGDMSFIGPRPEREELVQEIETEVPYFRFRHLTKPGLSGWAQINYGYGANIEDAKMKLSYDLYYLKNANLALDLLIVLRTFGAMMKGAR